MMIRTLLAIAVLAMAPVVPFSSAFAEAPLVKKQAPGYYRVMVGDIEVTALLDTTVKIPMHEYLLGAPKEQVAAGFDKHFTAMPPEVSVNAFLVNTGSKLVLIDTGVGGGMGSTAMLMDNLRSAGYRPEQVDEVYITHMHGDHIAGLVTGGARAFPNAVLIIYKADSD
jgi:glyoxylase-like metal-dependent hydrolase (beta-lactamase superfamily II)